CRCGPRPRVPRRPRSTTSWRCRRRTAWTRTKARPRRAWRPPRSTRTTRSRPPHARTTHTATRSCASRSPRRNSPGSAIPSRRSSRHSCRRCRPMSDARTRSPQASACTVVTERQLPAARVLARSYLDHHPDHDFVVLVVDRAEFPERPADHRVIGYRELDLDPDEFLRLATCCPAPELIEAVVPSLLRSLLDEYDVVVYLASETEVRAPFPEITRLGAEHGVVLAPRLLSPLPRDG